MSLLRGVSGKGAVKAFVRAGGVVRRGKSDHVNTKMPNGQIIIIPVSRDHKIGLLKSATRKSSIRSDLLVHIKLYFMYNKKTTDPDRKDKVQIAMPT